MPIFPIVTPVSINLDRLNKLPAMQCREMPRGQSVMWFHPEVTIWLRQDQLPELLGIVQQAIAEQPTAPLPAKEPV